MPSPDAFGYEYLLTIGIPETLVKVSVPPTPTSRDPIATADSPTTPSKLLDIAGIIDESFSGSGSSTQSRSKPTSDFRTVPGRFFEVVDKQLVAEIDNSKEVNSPAIISVYNLTDEQLNLTRENSVVTLRAGYRSDLVGATPNREDLPLIYIGTIISKSTKDDGEDRVTELVCSDGRTPLRNIKISMSWGPGTTYQDMVLDLLDISATAGIPLGKFTGDSEGETLLESKAPNGYQVVGFLGEQFSKLLSNIKYRMYLVLGKMYIEPLYVTPTVEVVNVTSNNIKGTVNEEEDGATSLSGSGEEKAGITFSTFLNGNISTNKFLRLSNLLNSRFEGDYKITSTRHSLNYEKDVWQTEVSATRIK